MVDTLYKDDGATTIGSTGYGTVRPSTSGAQILIEKLMVSGSCIIYEYDGSTMIPLATASEAGPVELKHPITYTHYLRIYNNSGATISMVPIGWVIA